MSHKAKRPGECRGEYPSILERWSALFVGVRNAFQAETGSLPRTQVRGRLFLKRFSPSQTIENLIGPEPLEPMQRLVEGRELVGADAADLLDRAHMLLIEPIDDVAHLD